MNVATSKGKKPIKQKLVELDQLTNVNEEPWKGQNFFLEELKRLSAAAERKVATNTICPTCTQSVHGLVFYTREWRWPSTILHFVEEHNARVPLEFYDFVLDWGSDKSDEDDEDEHPTVSKHKKPKLKLREGFYCDNPRGELPMAVTNNKKWLGQSAFVEKLKDLEEGAERARPIKGWYACTICKAKAGSTIFGEDDWEWKEGIVHYVTKHNVRPSLAFQEYVLGVHVKEDN